MYVFDHEGSKIALFAWRKVLDVFLELLSGSPAWNVEGVCLSLTALEASSYGIFEAFKNIAFPLANST